MTERVQVIVEAKDAASGVMRAITQQFGALGSLVEELSVKNISWGNVAQMATRMVVDGLKEAVSSTLEYANQVRSLSIISGESAEETSRFIQVLDDFKIGADDALVATRALTKNGLTPSIATLAKLSDQYLKINDAQERNEFVLKNLGRAGLEWVEVLGQGSDALLEMGDNVNANLILSQKQLDAARENEIAVDNWNDSLQALKISIGNELLPPLTSFLEHQQAMARASEILGKGLDVNVMATQEYKDALAQAKQEQADMNAAMTASAETSDIVAAALADQTLQAEALAKANKEITAANNEQLTLIGKMQSEEDRYQENKLRLAQERAGIAAGDLAALDENTRKTQENEAAHDKASKTIILGLLEQKLTQDGILTDDELNWLLDKGVAWGIYSQTVIDESKKAIDEANKLTDAVSRIPEHKRIKIDFDIDNLALGNEILRGGLPGYAEGGISTGPQSGHLEMLHGTEAVIPLKNGSVPVDLGGGSGANVVINLSSMFSLADMDQAKSRLLPILLDGIEEAKAQGRLR